MAVEHRKLLIIEDSIEQLKALSAYFGERIKYIQHPLSRTE